MYCRSRGNTLNKRTIGLMASGKVVCVMTRNVIVND